MSSWFTVLSSYRSKIDHLWIYTHNHMDAQIYTDKWVSVHLPSIYKCCMVYQTCTLHLFLSFRKVFHHLMLKNHQKKHKDNSPASASLPVFSVPLGAKTNFSLFLFKRVEIGWNQWMCDWKSHYRALWGRHVVMITLQYYFCSHM